MQNKFITKLEENSIDKINTLRTIPQFDSGDTVRVHIQVIEDTRKRIQKFEGVCIAKKNRGFNSSFTLRKISNGEGVERIFPNYSPSINKIEILRRGAVRRAKLYYMRSRTGKSSRIAEKTTGYKSKLNILARSKKK